MIKTVCDFCFKDVDFGGIAFKHKSKNYRIDISVCSIGHGNGVRYSRTDACAVCTLKFAVRAAQAILSLAEKQRKAKQCQKKATKNSKSCNKQFKGKKLG